MSKYETIYRVVENKDYNEFNAEMQYTILTYDYDKAKNKIRRRGWNSWHGLKGKKIFHSRTMAEKWLCELNYNYFFNKYAQADKTKWQDQQIAELQAKLNEYEIKCIKIKMYDEQLKNKDLQAKVKELEESEKLGIEYEKNAKKCIKYWQKEYNALKNQFDMLNKKYIEEMNKTDNLQSLPNQLEREIKQLQQQLEDFEKVAIVPKFKIGQTVFTYYKPYKTQIKYIQINEDHKIFYKASDIGLVQEDCLFATEEEVQKEMK